MTLGAFAFIAAAAGGQHLAVAAKGQGVRPLGDVLDPPHKGAVDGVPDGDFVIAPDRQFLSVAAEGQRRDGYRQ